MAALLYLTIVFIIAAEAKLLKEVSKEYCVSLDDSIRKYFEQQVEYHGEIIYDCKLESAALDYIECNNLDEVKKSHPELNITESTSIIKTTENNGFEKLVRNAFYNFVKHVEKEGERRMGCNYEFSLKDGLHKVACLFAE